MESGPKSPAQGLSVVKAVHVALPLTTTVFFVLASCIEKLWPSRRAARIEQETPRRLRLLFRRSTLLFALGIVLTYIADAALSTSKSTSPTGASKYDQSVLYDLSSGLLWFVILIRHVDCGCAVDYPLLGCGVLYLVPETVLSVTYAKHNILTVVCQAIRISFLFIPLLLYGALEILGKRPRSCVDAENAPLLDSNQQDPDSTEPPEPGSSAQAYGSCSSKPSTPSTTAKTQKASTASAPGSDTEQDSGKNGDLWKSIEDFKMLVPFFWPSGRARLQLAYVGIALCLIAERVINVMLPLQVGLITDILSGTTGRLPWKEIVLFAVLRLFDSGSGLPSIRRFIWMPLEDFSYEKLSSATFDRIMTLSCDFHDSKSSGRLWQIVYRGQSVKDVVSNICFNVLPLMVDLVLAVSVLYYIFDAYMALIVAAVSVMFVYVSGKIVSKQREKRKHLIEKRTQEFTILCESTTNWQTVTYFNRVPYEQTRYRAAVRNQLKSRFHFKFWDQLENTTQSFLLTSGLMVASIMAAYQVVSGLKPIGSFIMLLSYWGQLSGPLQFIASGLGEIALNIVDVEELLDLLRQQPTVTDAADAKPCVFGQGGIEFSGVNFSYDGKREVLRDISFNALPGQTTALVGKTGGGKSTILKLISRFYNPTSGTVKIDGQDLSQVTLSSLRENIGVVPQDPALFHDSIMNNIRYARFDATDDEIIEACKAVALHERFSEFTDGYNTIVGERGAKLSGGELQRVAIARAIIKDPKIALLDEATSSVDSETEAHVQESLQLLCAGRTTVVIAHRLSTIMDADKIIVIGDEGIVEQGSHFELLKREGYYYRLCARQGVANSTDLKNSATGKAVVTDDDFANPEVEAAPVSHKISDCEGVRYLETESPREFSNWASEETVDGQQGGEAGRAGARSILRAADFTPRSPRTESHEYSQSCLAETDGNQGASKHAERQQYKSVREKRSGIISAGKENLPGQMHINAPKIELQGQSSDNDAVTDKNDQKPQTAENTAHTIRTPCQPTLRTRDLTRSEPTAPGLSIDDTLHGNSEASDYSGLEASNANAQRPTSTRTKAAAARPQRRRRRKRHLQSKDKCKA